MTEVETILQGSSELRSLLYMRGDARVCVMILSKESLQAYSRKPDCFRQAASQIQTKCAELETNEAARVKGETDVAHCLTATA